MKGRHLSFAIPYEPFTVDASKLLSKDTMTVEEAQRLLDTLNREFPKVSEWVKKMKTGRFSSPSIWNLPSRTRK